jgi:hypothetical protein
MKTTTILVALLLAVVAFSNTGCKGCGENVAESAMKAAVKSASGGKADIDVGSSVDISGLPEFLRYPGAKATASWSATTDEGTGTSYVFEVADARPAVVEFYKKALASWKNSSTMESEDVVVMMYGSADEKEFATVTIGKSDDKTALTILYLKKP